MAIYRFSLKNVKRSAGRSAVAAAAYRSAANLLNEMDGVRHDYRKRKGVDYSEIILPKGSRAKWALDRSALWNAAEAIEKRKDSRTANEIQLALPVELSATIRLELTKKMAQIIADRYGVAVDIAIHAPGPNSDSRNHHAHLLFTTRVVNENGLGRKSDLNLSNTQLFEHGLPRTQDQLEALREKWADLVNEALARNLRPVRVDHRSYERQGASFSGQTQQGPRAAAMERRARAGKCPMPDRLKIDPVDATKNAIEILKNPEKLVDLITSKQSVFTRRDLAQRINALVNPDDFANCLAACEAVCVRLDAGSIDENGNPTPPNLTTHAVLRMERELAETANSLNKMKSGRIVAHRSLSWWHSKSGITLTQEQIDAVMHAGAPGCLKIIVGRPGTGKTTAMAALAYSAKLCNQRIIAVAPSATASQKLAEETSSDAEFTISRLLVQLRTRRTKLTSSDVLILDEVSMASSRDLLEVMKAVREAGAKLILLGDPDQLQSVQAGGALKYLIEKFGAVHMNNITRQKVEEHRVASTKMSQGDHVSALEIYKDRGEMRFANTADRARVALVDEWLTVRLSTGSPPLVLAHTKKDVAELNQAIRQKIMHELGPQTGFAGSDFRIGDRIVFRKNDYDKGIRNGLMGQIVAGDTGTLSVKLDDGKIIKISGDQYRKIELGYASTIHRSQGLTADSVLAFGSPGLNRNLLLVMMTRHRYSFRMYAGADQFSNWADFVKKATRPGGKLSTLDFYDPLGPTPAAPASRPKAATEAPRARPEPAKPQQAPKQPEPDPDPPKPSYRGPSPSF